MKLKLMKGSIFLKLILLMVLFSSVLAAPLVHASDHLQVVGSNAGLKVIPQDQNLFKELNLSPGDYRESKLTIRNNYSNAFELFVGAKRLGKEPPRGEPDLYKKLLMRITLGDKEIYTGPMINFAKDKAVSLGKFKPGEIQEMDVVLHLPGSETGNEFMKTSLRNQWIFTAQSDTLIDDEDSSPGAKLPQTGGVPAVFFYVAGAVIAITGITMKNKK